MMLRPATPDDRDAVYAIYMHPAVVPYLAHDPMPPDAFADVFARLLANGLMIWEQGGAVAGFYRAPRHEGRASHVAMLSTFAVRPDLRGTGVARAMVEDAIARLRAQGVTRLELLAEADNPRGLAFYRKLGFQQEGVMRAAYRRAGEDGHVDEIVMAMLLDKSAGAA